MNNKEQAQQAAENYSEGEEVIQYEGMPHEQKVIYISDFMFKGGRWFNVQLPNGGYMETQFITKIK